MASLNSTVGAEDGISLGDSDGASLNSTVGAEDGISLGDSDGALLNSTVGAEDGAVEVDGIFDGDVDEVDDGLVLVDSDGDADGVVTLRCLRFLVKKMSFSEYIGIMLGLTRRRFLTSLRCCWWCCWEAAAAVECCCWSITNV